MQIYFFVVVVVKYIMTYAAVFIVAIQFTQLYNKIEETKENQINFEKINPTWKRWQEWKLLLNLPYYLPGRL